MEILAVFLVGLCCVLQSNGIEVEALENNGCQNFQPHTVMMQEKQSYRTSFHFQPPRNWLNGINIYSFFYFFLVNFNHLACSFPSFFMCLCILKTGFNLCV